MTERGGQVDPQPRAEPVREAMPPLRGAKITDFQSIKPESYRLTYELRGRKHMVNYTLAPSGTVTFQFVDDTGKTTTETYNRRPRGRGPGDEPPPPPSGNPPGRRPPPPPPPPRADNSNLRPNARQTDPNEPPPFRTEVPDHPLDVILGRPTASSVTLSIVSYDDAEGFVTYGTTRTT